MFTTRVRVRVRVVVSVGLGLGLWFDTALDMATLYTTMPQGRCLTPILTLTLRV